MTTESNENKIDSVAFVAKGSFNPAILHPEWFLRHSIIPQEEVDSLLAEPLRKEIPDVGIIEFGKNFIVEPTQAILSFKSLAIKVDRERFDVICRSRDKFPFMLEVIKKIFIVLPETPVAAYGINIFEHIQFEESSEVILNKFFTANESIKSFFGPDQKYGHKIISKNGDSIKVLQIERSNRLQDALYIFLNSHYQNTSVGNDFLIKNLSKNFSDTLSFAEKLIQTYCGPIVKKIEKNK